MDNNDAESPSVNWAVCTCNSCSGHLEFDAANAGETILCPHCGLETILFIPGAPSPPRSPPPVLSLDDQVELRKIRTVIATTGNEISGRSVKSYLGIARGIVVRSPNIAQGMLGGLKQIVGGNIESYAKVCEEARRDAFERMMRHAKELNADAVIAVRYDATEFTQGATEVLAYGTAVKLNDQSGL